MDLTRSLSPGGQYVHLLTRLVCFWFVRPLDCVVAVRARVPVLLQCGVQGHLSIDCFSRGGKKYDLVDEEDPRDAPAMTNGGGGGGRGNRGGDMRGVYREVIIVRRHQAVLCVASPHAALFVCRCMLLTRYVVVA